MAFRKTIGKRLQGSFAGTITRGGDQLTQARTIAEDIKFGAPIKLDAAKNQWKNFEASDAETVIMGIAVRSIKQAATLVGDQELTPANSDMDALTRGFIAVKVANGSPAINGTPYVITRIGSTGLLIGDFVADEFVGSQIETAICTTGAVTTSGTITVTVTAAGMPNSPKAVELEVVSADTVEEVAELVRVALAADPDVGAFFAVSGVDANVILSTVTPAATDATLAIVVVDTDTTGVVFSASTDTSVSALSVAVSNMKWTTTKDSLNNTAEVHVLTARI